MSAELSGEYLAELLGRTLEEAAFVFAEPADGDGVMDETLLEARLAYAGPHQGELVLTAPRSFAATLAANLLGEDEGGTAATGDDEDALGELLNMIAGALVDEIFPPGDRCLLGLPRVGRAAPLAHARALASAHASATLVDEQGRRIDLAACLVPGSAP